jgi:hypothetical protein
MAVQIIVSQSGPLPVSTVFNAPGDEPMILEVNGSVWSSYAGLMVGIGIDLDGTTIGAAQIFANSSTMHLAVSPAYIPVQLSEGEHTLYLYLMTGETESDVNDFVNAVLHY